MSTYHQDMAARKRAAITGAATALFLEAGYDGTSLARIADAAGVSKATLFKQFPTKAALFDAIVTESWQAGDDDPPPPTGDLARGLTVIGRRYAALLSAPGMAALFRIVIAELPRFPELGETQFQRGKLPYFESVRKYLENEHEAGAARVDDPVTAANQFLGMISNFVFWPRMLLIHWDPDETEIAHAVHEAVRTMIARYAAGSTATTSQESPAGP
ncbi:TetR/AcrR family transcriptional regulator [Catenuloplanes japonicus]|uniref:TetR/AcrR family transcriptional regulator n=1 Tax=Catenuloplanes japonicus TaxID=33876 RepID=UPI00068BD74E|nr:TetR/AcrR family transcriptional regulator [Catenuloplanes japonicus]